MCWQRGGKKWTAAWHCRDIYSLKGSSLTKILMSTHENLMRFSWENENCQRFSWESHELFTKSHENLTRFSFSRENWNVFSWDFLAFMSFSWDFSRVSHEILVSLFFTWKLERFLMRIWWECHEILMSIFGHFLMKTLNMEIDACTEFSWGSHEILTRLKIFSRDFHESAVASWASHEILMRFSRDSHEILTRFLWDSHEIQVYRYNEHKPKPSVLFFNFFFVRLATFCEVTLAAKKSTTSSTSLSIKTCWSQTATVSFKHFHCLYWQHFFGKTQVASFASDS